MAPYPKDWASSQVPFILESQGSILMLRTGGGVSGLQGLYRGSAQLVPRLKILRTLDLDDDIEGLGKGA